MVEGRQVVEGQRALPAGGCLALNELVVTGGCLTLLRTLALTPQGAVVNEQECRMSWCLSTLGSLAW